MKDPVLFLSGYAVLETDAEHAAALLNAFLRFDLPFSELISDPAGGIRLTCSAGSAKRVAGVAGCTIRKRGGLPVLLLRLLRRPGLLLGGLCMLALLLVSRLFVWDVRVTGNESMSAAEVIAELRENGFGVGTYLPGVSAGEVENRVLLTSDRLAWISVFLDGTVAKVQVLERTPVPTQEDRKRPADLVARMDGQIEFLELYRGNPVVHIGQAVRRGELLVSGIFEHENIGCRFTRSAGRVMARTEHSFTVEIPLRDTEKVCFGTEKGDVWLNFFAFTGKISENTGNEAVSCDIIETVTQPSLWFLRNLPISLRCETRRLWQEELVERSPEDALALAYERLDGELRTLTENAQLLSRTTELTMTDDAVILVCTVTCIEDIAEQVEFDITD